MSSILPLFSYIKHILMIVYQLSILWLEYEHL